MKNKPTLHEAAALVVRMHRQGFLTTPDINDLDEALKAEVAAHDTHAEKMVRELFENYPEASMSSLLCTGWNYKQFIFDFIGADYKPHRITIENAVKGWDLFCKARDNGKLPGLSLGSNWRNDGGDWDSYAIDALAQMAIFGEVIYG